MAWKSIYKHLGSQPFVPLGSQVFFVCHIDHLQDHKIFVGSLFTNDVVGAASPTRYHNIYATSSTTSECFCVYFIYFFPFEAFFLPIKPIFSPAINSI